MNRYLKLFSVTCDHEFYARGVSSDLKFVPTPDTQKLLKNLSLLLKTMPGGFQVFYIAREGVQHVLEKLIKPETFSFLIYNQNPLFSSFSNIPFEGSGDGEIKAYFFHNLQTEKQGEHLALHPNEYVQQTDQYSIKGMAFEYRWEKEDQPKTVQVKNESGDAVFEEYIPNELMSSVNINLSNEPSGKYDLLATGKVVDTFLTVPANPRQCFGFLQIKFGEVASPEYELITGGKISPKDYHIRFAARDTTWKYFITIKNKSQYGKPEIYQGKKKADFLNPEEVTLNDGSQAYMLESKQHLPLRQLPQQSFRLRLTDPDGSNPVTMDLPGPNPSQLKPRLVDGKPVLDERTQNPIVYSEIYVYV